MFLIILPLNRMTESQLARLC